MESDSAQSHPNLTIQEQVPQEPPKKKNTFVTVLIVAAVLFGIMFITAPFIIGYTMYWNYQKVQDQVPPPVITKTIEKPIASEVSDMLVWETYTNDKHGYTFKYPPDFVSNIREGDWGIGLDCHCYNFRWFDIEHFVTNLDSEQWWNTTGINIFNGSVMNDKHHLEADSYSTNWEEVNGKEIFVIDAKTKELVRDESDPRAYLNQQKHFSIYIISTESGVLTITKEENQYFDQVLSTFEFVDEEGEIDDTSIVVMNSEEGDAVVIGEEFYVRHGLVHNDQLYGDIQLKLVDSNKDSVVVEVLAKQLPNFEFLPEDEIETVTITDNICIGAYPFVMDVAYEYCFEVENEDSVVTLYYEATGKSTLPLP